MSTVRSVRNAALAVLALAAVLVGAAGTIVAMLPARFADIMLARATQDRVRLAQTQGSIWNGSGRLVLAPGRSVAVDGPAAAGAAFKRRVLAGVSIPGRVSWTLRSLPLLAGRFDLRLYPDSAAQPIRVQGDWQEVRIDPAAMELPAVELGRLGSPWNTVRPAGALSLGWDHLLLRHGSFDGHAWIELRNVSSSMTPVRPLGSYRVDLVGGADGDGRIRLQLTTVEGPLQLRGSGAFDPVRGLHFIAEASAQPPEKERLQTFLGLVGQRQGEDTIIRIGA